MNNRQKEVLFCYIDDEKNVMKRLENNYIYSLAEVKRYIKELQKKPDTQSKAYQLQFQKQLEKQLNNILSGLQSKNYATLTNYMNECYSQGYLGAMYDIAGQGIPIVSPIDEKLVAKACGKTSDDIKLANKLGVNTKLLKKQTLAEMQRGFSTSMTYSDMARNISARGQADMNRSKVIARTEGHRIQNEAKLDAMIEAKKKGADVLKQWDATMDGQVRPEHRQLDGQIREIEDEFEVAGMKAQNPGGFGIAYMDCNCRCAILERARWALDGEELKTLQRRAELFGLDKTKSFDDFKEKYLAIATEMEKVGDGDRIIKSMKFATPQGLLSNGKYRGKVYSLTSDKNLQKQYFDNISKMLKHRGGSNGEDLCLYNASSGKWCVSTSGRTRSRPAYTDEIKKFINKSKSNELIAFHNHPESTPPSIPDLNAALKNGYREAFTIGHNGNIYRYTAPDREVDEYIYQLRVANYIEKGYNTNDAKVKALHYIKKLYNFEFSEVI